MTPARASVAALLAGVAALVGWIGLDWWEGRGGDPLPLPWTAAAGLLVLAVAVLAVGLPVRRWVSGRRDRPLDPLLAARVAVLAKAAVYGGALFTGWYAAQGLAVLPEVIGARRTRLLVALLTAAAALVLTVVGFVVQQWCRVPPDDEPPQGDTADGDPAATP